MNEYEEWDTAKNKHRRGAIREVMPRVLLYVRAHGDGAPGNPLIVYVCV